MMLIRTELKPSPIHGLGCFAAEDVPKGAEVWRFEEGLDRIFSLAEFSQLPRVVRDAARKFAYENLDGTLTLDGDNGRYCNHSEDPNIGDTGVNFDDRCIALRPIRAGEEITCNYYSFDARASRKLKP